MQNKRKVVRSTGEIVEKSSDFPFETLTKRYLAKYDLIRSYDTVWYPTPIKAYLKAIKINKEEPKDHALSKNISYNLQYLEFLQKELNELVLSGVIKATIIKTYIITAISILEGLFTYIEKEYIGETHSDAPTLYDLIDKLKAHPQVLNIPDDETYGKLHEIRKLRNKIHLSKLKNMNSSKDTEDEGAVIMDHDYNIFDDDQHLLVQSTLYKILTLKVVTDEPELFDFLKPDKK